MSNLAAMTHGSAVVYPAATFDPGATLAAVQTESCTALQGVPTMFISELNHKHFSSFKLNTLRTGIMAGSVCPVETMNNVSAICKKKKKKKNNQRTFGLTCRNK